MLRLKRRKKRDVTEFKNMSEPGAPPGNLVVPADALKPVIETMAYGKGEFVEGEVEEVSAISDLLEAWPVTWVNVTGTGDATKMRALAKLFNVHSLALEDVVNHNQRPKVDDYESNLFVVTRMLRLDDGVLQTEQLSMFLTDRAILTFQSVPGDCLGPVRKRIRKQKSKILREGADYLAYSILDAVIDAYFPVLEHYSERLEELEAKILEHPESHLIADLHEVKRDLLVLRRSIWPIREVVNSLIRDTYPTVTEETRLYLRDCYDHAVRIIDLIENYRQIAADLMDVYLSMVSNRMNEVMKVLTVISTIFIPPTFVAGIYGMNFNTGISPFNMPELDAYYGYPICLGVMTLMTTGVLIFLYTRGWLRSS